MCAAEPRGRADAGAREDARAAARRASADASSVEAPAGAAGEEAGVATHVTEPEAAERPSALRRPADRRPVTFAALVIPSYSTRNSGMHLLMVEHLCRIAGRPN